VKINNGENWETNKEINRMRKLNNENVIKLLGKVSPENHDSRYCNCETRGLDETTSWILMEYMPMGNLHKYISDYTGGVPAHGMIKIAYQVASGMMYLHKYANTVHMDLAARNVLVKDNNFNVKIGDFGVLCDYEYSEQYYQNDAGDACPVRWMPPENLPLNGSEAHYSRKGDVWSFGVLLFEIWSRGRLPFENLDNEEVMERVYNYEETVLDYFDLKARSWIKDLMKECFAFDSTDRPNFRYISETISDESEFQL